MQWHDGLFRALLGCSGFSRLLIPERPLLCVVYYLVKVMRQRGSVTKPTVFLGIDISATNAAHKLLMPS